MQINLFIVDDHYMIIEGIQSLLVQEKDISWMGHATSAASCLAFLKNNQPDVILMDINLPDKTGIDLCKEVKSLYHSIFIIGLSTFNQHSFISKMMDNGASGYILKNATRPELVEAIHTVIKGKLFFSNEAALALQQSPDINIILTRREKEVLELIANGLTNNEIAEQLYISITTVDTHRKNLLSKFDSRNVASLVRKASQLNFI
ncbi:response regulator transcription factor [Niabella yanshanensis]|uniref:Response regulator transcription factor n=1 Tax=Niabella yanshanensis TaxID=577386 RepID=A0ABZ0W3C8_9BACT|nr:response regulator transcription factor [Niabella yanshanensis]WQD37747.1 response regulator transcription factor [Niabella yanshanensis]